MMSKQFSYREYLEKVDRLKDLEEEGFNIPRFFFLDQNSTEEEIEECISWANNINKRDSSQIFNIRTYQYFKLKEKEVSSCPHSTDILFHHLKDNLISLNKSYITMIDAESPNHGRMAGTISTFNDPKYTYFEFVIKPFRAMVRDINSDPNVNKLSISDMKEIDNLTMFTPDQKNSFKHLFFKVNHFYKRNLIFEFTMFDRPAGIMFNDLISYPEAFVVWWEYRSTGMTVKTIS